MPIAVNLKRKFFASTSHIEAADFHPTQPWLLTGHSSGSVSIYNLENGKVIRAFSLYPVYVYCVKFIARKNWYVVGLKDGKLRIFDCTTHEEVNALQAHTDTVRCLAVHPTAPIVLTCSNDKTIKAWDCDKRWRNIQIYKGHTGWITSIALNSKDPNTFASASNDCTLKMWSISSPTPTFSIKAHSWHVSCVDFYSGTDKPYLITTSSDRTIKVWDYLSQTCVQTITGHTNEVAFAVFHPSLPIIISGSKDQTVRIWNTTSNRFEHVLSYKLGWARCIALRKDMSEVAIGFDKAVLNLELTNSVPLRMAASRSDMNAEVSKEPVQKFSEDRDIKKPAMRRTVLDHALKLPKFTTAYYTAPSLSPPFTSPSQSQAAHRHNVKSYRECISLAMELMTVKATNKLISELRGDNAQHVADLLSEMVSDKETFTQRDRKHTLHLLSKLAKLAVAFPRSLVLKNAQCNLANPVAWGGYGVIYKGEHDGITICVKAVQADSEGVDEKKLKAHASELTIWGHMEHLNVLPFLGIFASKEEVPRICIVSPWMNNGDLVQYLKTDPEIPRKPLVHDIISGLQYLHDLDIIHADLKAKNVLVSESGRAMLADFGISRLSMTQTTMVTNAGTGTVYWMAPELLLEQKPASRESDIWAFACTCYEMIAGTMPFSQYYNIALLIGAFVMSKFIPKKPTPEVGWDEDVWSLAMQCWQGDPASRPSAQELLDMINSITYSDDRSPDANVRRSRSSDKPDYDRIFRILDEIRQSAAA